MGNLYFQILSDKMNRSSREQQWQSLTKPERSKLEALVVHLHRGMGRLQTEMENCDSMV